MSLLRAEVREELVRCERGENDDEPKDRLVRGKRQYTTGKANLRVGEGKGQHQEKRGQNKKNNVEKIGVIKGQRKDPGWPRF